MNIKLRPRSNGEPTKPKWEQDDEDMALANKLAAALESEVPDMPPMDVKPAKPAQRSDAVRSGSDKVRPEATPINVVDVIETILQAYTEPGVHMWIVGDTLCFEQVVKEDGELYKNQFRIQIASYKTGRVKLIK